MTAVIPPPQPKSVRVALYVTVGTLLAAAVLGGWFIIVGDQANIAGRAWLTFFLIALFAGAVILDTTLSRRSVGWYLPVSTITNVVIVAVGLLKLWNGPWQPEDTANSGVWFLQIIRLFAVIVLLRLALGATQLYVKFVLKRAKSPLTQGIGYLTLALIWIAVLVLAIPAAFPEVTWPDWWWRIAGAAALVAVVAAVIPLVVRAFEPRAENPAAAQQAAVHLAAQQAAQQQYEAQLRAQQVPPTPPVAPPQ